MVLCTFPDADSARQIGTVLVEKQLAACVNLIPAVESIYRWQGKVETAAEVLAIFKTSAAAFPEFERALAGLIPTRCRKSWPSSPPPWRKPMLRGCSIPWHRRIDDLRPHVDAAAHGEGVFHAVGAEEGGGSLRAHAVVAIDDDSALGVGGELVDHLRETPQRKPLVAVDPADDQFVRLPAIDQARALVRGQIDATPPRRAG